MATEETKHDSITIALHWIIAIGIVVLAGTELIRHEFPKGGLIREGLKPLHQPLGASLFVLILLRIVYQLFVRRPPVHGDHRLTAFAASAMHLALYALMIAVPLMGLIAVLGRDRPIDFGLFAIALPLKAYIGGLAHDAREAHEFLGTSILVLAGIHAAAALAHHYVLGDGVLLRMLPGRRNNADKRAA